MWYWRSSADSSLKARPLSWVDDLIYHVHFVLPLKPFVAFNSTSADEEVLIANSLHQVAPVVTGVESVAAGWYIEASNRSLCQASDKVLTAVP